MNIISSYKMGISPNQNKNRIGWFTQGTSSFLVVSYSTIPFLCRWPAWWCPHWPSRWPQWLGWQCTPLPCSAAQHASSFCGSMAFCSWHFHQNQTGFVLTFQSWDESGASPSQHIRFFVLSRPMHAMSRQRHASDLEQKPLQLFSTGSSHQINEQNTINGVLHFQILYFLRPLLTPFPSWGWKTGLVTVLTRNIAIHDCPVSPQDIGWNHHLCNFQQKLWQFIASSIMWDQPKCPCLPLFHHMVPQNSPLRRGFSIWDLSTPNEKKNISSFTDSPFILWRYLAKSVGRLPCATCR